LVTAIETEEGRRWAESRIKALTGGDKISARFMRADFFEYTPAFKLVIAGNHKPGLRSVDEAIRRRFHLIPFTVTIPEEKRDPDLFENCPRSGREFSIDDQRRSALARAGLASRGSYGGDQSYLEAEDALSAWLDESCTREVSGWESTGALFASWRLWAEKAGEHPGTMKRFVQNLEVRGFMPERVHAGRGFRGLKLTPQEQAERHWDR
jgi:putative DNA primase/helicase